MAAVNSGAVLLIGAGVWVLFQVFGGDALGRLGIAGAPTKVGTGAIAGQIGAGAAAATPSSGPLPAPAVQGVQV